MSLGNQHQEVVTHYLENNMTQRVTVSSLLDELFTPSPIKEEDGGKSDAAAMAEGEVTVDDIVDKVNSIRSGKSLDNEQVSSAMETWVNGLDDAERTALLSFLKGIAQIVTGEVPAAAASEPSDNPASVDMKKDPKALKINVKPNVIKGPGSSSGSTKSGKSGVENTSAPVPVKVRSRG